MSVIGHHSCLRPNVRPKDTVQQQIRQLQVGCATFAQGSVRDTDRSNDRRVVLVSGDVSL